MPEYSSTTITPADGVQVPSMNGSTSGNFLLSALRDYILASKGQANGLASLGSDGKLTASQLPDLADDVIVVASYAVLPATGAAGKIYITADNNKMYRWDSDEADYVELSVDLSEYAKLTDLAAEETARETADTNLNNALTAIDHRVSNLEQAKGKYVVSNYKDGAITPSGKGNWAVVEGLRGVSRVENNLLKTKNDSASGITITPSTGNKVVINGTATADISQTTYFCGITNLDIQAGKVVLLGGFSNAKITLKWIGQGYLGGFQEVAGTPQVITATNGMFRFSMVIASGTTFDNEEIELPFVTDLNIYFGTSDLSFLGATDSAKLATIQTNYPHLLLPSDYGVRIVDSSYSGVRAWARNLWDEQWERGSYNLSTGEATDYVNNFRNKNIIDVKPNTTYYFMVPYNSYALKYDADGNYLGYTPIVAPYTVFTTEGNVRTLNFTVGAGGASYANNICLNVSDSLNGTYTPYHAPSTLSLTFQGKSAGSVYDSLETNVGIEQEIDGQKVKIYKKRTTQRIGSYTFSDSDTFEYASTSTSGVYRITTSVISDLVKRVSVTETANLLIAGYERRTANQTYLLNMGVCLEGGKVMFYDPNYNTASSADAFKAHIKGLTLYYELADPVVTLSDPLIDNTLLTESGGRMATVQTGTVVDGSFDMGFITL